MIIFNRSDSFENPVLQQHFRNLEALALDLTEPERAEDLTCKEATTEGGFLSWEAFSLVSLWTAMWVDFLAPS